MKYLLLLLLVCVLTSMVKGYHQRPRQQDIHILLNSGESRTILKRSQGLLRELLHFVSISPATTRIGIITYDNKVTVHCQLNETTNRETVLQTIQSLRFSKSKGNNKLHPALHTARISFRKQKRQRIYRTYAGRFKVSSTSVPQYIIIFDHIYHLWRFNTRRKRRACNFGSSYYLFSFESYKDTFFSRQPYLYLSRYHYRIKTKFDATRAIKKIFRTPPFHGLFGVCQPGRKYQHDECGRRCICYQGKLTDCYRVRREFTQLNIKERLRYINAYHALTSIYKLSSKFNVFTKIHKDFFCSGIHTKEYFFPWHRWYVLAMENQMRALDCRLTAVYWDWSYWHDVAWQPNIHIWGNHRYQLGSDGGNLPNFCIRDGPFAHKSWRTPPWDKPLIIVTETNNYLKLSNLSSLTDRANVNGNLSHCLRRRFNVPTPTIGDVEHALSQTAANFSEFERIVREEFHNDVHNAIGGHMCTDYASEAPEFFMHHAMLDKIWSLWQRKSRDRKYFYFMNRTKTMAHLKCPFSPVSLIDNSRLPNLVKVVYSRFPSDYSSDYRKKNWIWKGQNYQRSKNLRKSARIIFCHD